MTAIFDSRVNGVPCKVHVLDYTPEKPSIFSRGMWQPPESTVFEYEILDRRGRRATWLDRYVDDDTDMRLLCEFTEAKAEYFTGDRCDD